MSVEGQKKQHRRDDDGNYMKSWIILMFSVFPLPTRIRFGVEDSKHWLESSTRNHILTVLFTLSIPHFHQERRRPGAWWMAKRGEKWKLCRPSSILESLLSSSSTRHRRRRLPFPALCAACSSDRKAIALQDIDCERVQKNIINYRITFLSSLAFSVRLLRVQREDLAVFEFQLIANCNLSFFFSMCSQFSHLSSPRESQSPRECVQESW